MKCNVMNMVKHITETQILPILGKTNFLSEIQWAYLNLYDPSNPPIKHILKQGKHSAVIMMPYTNSRDGIYFEKILFIDRLRRPGITGYAILYDLRQNEPISFIDATALTGFRTAAKSLLFASKYFDNWVRSSPRLVRIYGSSTQAFFHALLFSNYYPDSSIDVIVRSEKSRHRFDALLKGYASKVIHVSTDIKKAKPDIIITATASAWPIITPLHYNSARLIIAVGSSSDQVSEVDSAIVAKCNLYIDARISIAGKGEFANLSKSKRKSIKELSRVLKEGQHHSYGKAATTLFVSKGLVIEDYVLALKLARLNNDNKTFHSNG